MVNRLLQDETQDSQSKGLCRWFASRVNARQEASLVGEEISRERMLEQCITVSELKAELMTDPKFVEAYDNLQMKVILSDKPEADRKAVSFVRRVEAKAVLRSHIERMKRLTRRGADASDFETVENETVTKLSKIFTDSLDK